MSGAVRRYVRIRCSATPMIPAALEGFLQHYGYLAVFAGAFLEGKPFSRHGRRTGLGGRHNDEIRAGRGTSDTRMTRWIF